MSLAFFFGGGGGLKQVQIRTAKINIYFFAILVRLGHTLQELTPVWSWIVIGASGMNIVGLKPKKRSLLIRSCGKGRGMGRISRQNVLARRHGCEGGGRKKKKTRMMMKKVRGREKEEGGREREREREERMGRYQKQISHSLR